MPKASTTKAAPLPAWANEPLKFGCSPDEALRQGARIRLPKDWRKAGKTVRKNRK